MNFETRIYILRHVQGPEEAARIIKSDERKIYEALTWKGAAHQFYCVAAGHIDDPFLEVAVLRDGPDNEKYQIESITAGWIDDPDQLARYLADAQSGSPYRKVVFIVNKPKGDEVAWFICSCCGQDFKGNVAQQLTYDQDSGYGLCNACR